jgi:hypothetical protein
MDLPTKTDDIRLSIPQILEQVNKEKFHDEKVKILQMNNHLGLQIYLKALVHPNITFKLPRGQIPVKNSDQHTGDTPVGLYKLEKAHLWISGTAECERMNSIERERTFMEFADTMDRTELPVLIALKDKDRSKWPGLYDQCIVDAFPEMFEEEEKKLLNPDIPKPKPGPKPKP